MIKREVQYVSGMVVFGLGIIIAAVFNWEDLLQVYFGVFIGVLYCEFMYQHGFRKYKNS